MALPWYRAPHSQYITQCNPPDIWFYLTEHGYHLNGTPVVPCPTLHPLIPPTQGQKVVESWLNGSSPKSHYYNGKFALWALSFYFTEHGYHLNGTPVVPCPTLHPLIPPTLPPEMRFTEEKFMSVIVYCCLFIMAAVGNLTIFITLFRNRYILHALFSRSEHWFHPVLSVTPGH